MGGTTYQVCSSFSKLLYLDFGTSIPVRKEKGSKLQHGLLRHCNVEAKLRMRNVDGSGHIEHPEGRRGITLLDGFTHLTLCDG